MKVFLGLGFEPDAVDILSTTPGVDFASAFKQSTAIEDNHIRCRCTQKINQQQKYFTTTRLSFLHYQYP